MFFARELQIGILSSVITAGKSDELMRHRIKRRGDFMIIQPKREKRNVNDSFFQQHEAKRIAKLNDVFGNVELTNNEEKVLIWLAGLDDWTVDKQV